jgi:CII-binding regulator of phage lambda lysogenization HflD
LQGEEVVLEAPEPVVEAGEDKSEEMTGEAIEPMATLAEKGRAAGEKKAAGLSLVPESEEKKAAFLYQLSHLPETVQHLEERVKKLEEAQRHQLDLRGFIEHLLAVERDLKKEEKLLQEIDRLVAENRTLEEKVNQERERLAKRSRELSEIYEILNSMLSEFMHLESVAKLASLGDFIHRLEITVDQFGNVLKSRKV